MLLIRWATIEDHLQGFRGSPDHQEWQRRTHPFYAAQSLVEHYRAG